MRGGDSPRSGGGDSRRMAISLRDHRVRLLLIAALALGAYLVLRNVVPEIDLQELLEDVATTLGDWTYLLVGAFAFLETGAFVGLVVPGETVVILAGAVAGVGETSVYLTLAIVWAAAWAGDTASFLIGRRLGRDFILRHGPKVRITRERFAQVEGYFSRHGGKTILIGRFIGLVRALAPFTAGSSGMRYAQFVPFSILGTGLWAGTFTVIGFFAARSLDRAAEIAGRGTFLFAVTVGVIVAIVLAVRFLRVADNRARLVAAMERREALRPVVALGRRVRPQARFVWNRVTPGGLGLELTTLLAALAVGLFVVIAYAATVSADPAPTPGDITALEAARDINAGWLTDAAKALTELGSAAVAWPVAAVAAFALAVRGRWTEVAVVVFAMLITIAAVEELKELIDRPRPGNGLVETAGGGFPSGHAAYSVIYGWLAVTLAVRLRPGLPGGTALVVAGIALTAVVGLSRVYLQVHYLSDATAGWAVGVSAFSACAAIAIVATHLRQNARVDGGGDRG